MRNQDIRVRTATEDDARLLADLGARTFVQAFGADNNPDDLAEYLAATFGPAIQSAELADPATVLLIAQVGEEPAGYAKIRFAEAPDYVPGDRPAELVRIYADQQWIGQGVGSALMRSCFEVVSARGYDAVWLSTWEINRRGIAFYNRWGFAVVGHQVFMVGRDAQNDLVMSRMLPAGGARVGEEYSAYRSAELAELYDAVYADYGDIAFWEGLAQSAQSGPLLELGCGTGRLLIPLARAGHQITGIDVAETMLERCRTKLQAEPPPVRDRVTLLEADMTSFDLRSRFELIYCAFGTFHHLRSFEEQLACVERCRVHLAPEGRLVLDLVNPDPALPDDSRGAPAVDHSRTGVVDWTDGRRVQGSLSVIGSDSALRYDVCEVTYEIDEADGTTRRLSETFPARLIFRYELEQLLARCGLHVTALYGDYDGSTFTDESPGMIVVAQPLNGRKALMNGLSAEVRGVARPSSGESSHTKGPRAGPQLWSRR